MPTATHRARHASLPPFPASAGRRPTASLASLAAFGAFAAAAAAGCDLSTTSPSGGGGGGGGTRLELRTVVQGLTQPVSLTTAPGDSRLFVVEQPGTIRILEGGVLAPTPFLDLTDRVGSAGPEQGLLGLAFHPDYAQNGRFFVSYTGVDGSSTVEELSADPGASEADPATGSLVLRVEQPQPNHNGGHLAFGPDGMLYLGLGDGGGEGDPEVNGQDPATLLGTILRLDVDGEAPYEIPPDNPFVGDPEARPEVWAYGLRNPWRFSWDPARDLLFVADVGQDRWEEVNVVASSQGGLNFGWSTMEGTDCFGASTCNQSGLQPPQIVYGHDQGCSVTGGVVYRGAAIPDLDGLYILGDYCQGWIAVAALQGPFVVAVQQLALSSAGSITSFGVDAQGEVYVLVAEGTLYRLVEAPTGA